MANIKISEYTATTTPDDLDLVEVVDVSDTTMAASGTNKKLTWANAKATLKTYFDTLYADALGADENYVTDAQLVVIGNTSGTNTGDNATNTQYSGLVTNATHTGEVTGSGALTVDKTAISNKTDTVITASDVILFSDASDTGNLKSDTVQGILDLMPGGGDVSKVGTPVNNQVGVWTGDGTIEGDSSLTFDTTTDTLAIGASGNLAFGAVTIIDDNAGTTTLQNIDAIDATTEATIEAAIDTLANLTSIQGRTVTLADAGADAILGWDDSANAYENLTQAEVLAVVGDAVADGTTKGVATFTANDFNASSGNISLDYTNGQKASTTQPGYLTEIAIDTEVTTGTDATRAVSPDALAGSTIFGRKAVSIQVTDGTADVTTGDGKAYFTIPESLNGMNLVRAQATVVTAGTTGASTIMIHNKTDANDMLSGAISIASAGTVGTVGTINGSFDDVATNDVIRIDVDSVSTTAPKGLVVILEFQLP